jgi:predicted ATP-grasp superfamily ATP-dependent carboligase
VRALIVEEVSSRSTLAAARALHAAGWTVGIGSPARTGLATSSRSSSYWHQIPAPSDGLERFLDAVAAAVDAGSYEVVFGAGDAELLALSVGRDALPTCVPYPPHSAVLRALDKVQLARAAEITGIPTPASYDVNEETLARVHGPMIMKARLHADPERIGAPTRIETRIVKNGVEAERRAVEISAMGGHPLLQRLLVGQLIECAVLVTGDGRTVARAQQVAERLWPPEAGISARAHTVPVDPALAARIDGLMAELGWSGLAQLQFLLTPEGESSLIDLNPRFYGSLALAVAAGVNLPALWARLATGGTVPYGLEARPGVRYHWLEGDLRSVLIARPGCPARELLDCLRYARSAVHSIWRLDDPLPAIRHAGALFARAARKGLASCLPS